MKITKQYVRKLTLPQISAGMNHCRDNAKRLLRSARALYRDKDYATALSLAVLAIEESGKISILRRMVIAGNDAEWRQCWKDFRSHCQKNGFADISTVLKPVLRLDDCRHLVIRSDRNLKVDELKQIGFYVDCVNEGDWLCPKKAISDEMAVKALTIAGILCRSDEKISVRELELWKETVGTCPHGTWQEQKRQVVLWWKRMETEGLKMSDPGFEKFVMEGFPISEMTNVGSTQNDRIAAIKSLLSVDSIWKDLEKTAVSLQSRQSKKDKRR